MCMCAFVYFIFKGEGIYLYEFTLVGRFPPRGARAFRRASACECSAAQHANTTVKRSGAERSNTAQRSGQAQRSNAA